MSINWNKFAVAAGIAGMSYFGVPAVDTEPAEPANPDTVRPAAD